MNVRERILTIGPPGAGKTYQFLLLARRLKDKGVRCFVIDTDDSYARMLSVGFSDLDNVTLFPAFEWPDFRKAAQRVMQDAKEGDWVSLDMADIAWTSVQRYYIAEVFGGEMGEYFLEARKKIKRDAKSLFAGRDAALKGWLDWPVLTRLYEDSMLSLIYRSPAHLYATSKPQVVSDDDDSLTKDLYGPYGVKPAGQKALGHQFHTVILFTFNKDGWYMTTIKDRERKRLEKVKLINFPIQYGKVAGWF